MVLTPTDDDNNYSQKDETKNWKMLGKTDEEIESCQWLTEPHDVLAWVKYCTSLRMSSSSDNRI